MIEIDTKIKKTAYLNTDDNKQQTDDKNQTSNTSNNFGKVFLIPINCHKFIRYYSEILMFLYRQTPYI